MWLWWFVRNNTQCGLHCVCMARRSNFSCCNQCVAWGPLCPQCAGPFPDLACLRLVVQKLKLERSMQFSPSDDNKPAEKVNCTRAYNKMSTFNSFTPFSSLMKSQRECFRWHHYMASVHMCCSVFLNVAVTSVPLHGLALSSLAVVQFHFSYSAVHKLV